MTLMQAQLQRTHQNELENCKALRSRERESELSILESRHANSIDRCEHQLTQMTDELATLNSQFSLLKIQSAQGEQQLAMVRVHEDSLSTELQSLKQDFQSLTTSNIQLSSNFTALQSTHELCQSKSEVCNRLERDNSAIQRQLTEMHSSHAVEMSLMKEQFSSTREQLDRSTSALNFSQEETKKANEIILKFQNDLTKYRQKLRVKQTSTLQQHQEMEQLQKHLQSTEQKVLELTDLNSTLNGRLESTEKERDQLQGNLQDSKKTVEENGKGFHPPRFPPFSSYRVASQAIERCRFKAPSSTPRVRNHAQPFAIVYSSGTASPTLEWTIRTCKHRFNHPCHHHQAHHARNCRRDH